MSWHCRCYRKLLAQQSHRRWGLKFSAEPEVLLRPQRGTKFWVQESVTIDLTSTDLLTALHPSWTTLHLNLLRDSSWMTSYILIDLDYHACRYDLQGFRDA